MPIHPPELIARLRLHLRLKRLQDDLRVKNETLGRLSTLDGLTGLRTRRYVDDVLSIEFLRAQRYGNSLTLMMGDLDHFKWVNDDYGHLAGDATLRGVASILLSDLRETDVAGRYGGEEILVVLARSQASGAKIFGERWREAVEESRFADPTGKQIAVTISIGIASLTEDMATPESLIAATDAALYRAKDAGRNRVEVADAGDEIQDGRSD
jgi:two-component system, cell cycle response regulator